MRLLILHDSQHERWGSSDMPLLEDCKEEKRSGQDDDDDDDDDDDYDYDDDDDDDMQNENEIDNDDDHDHKKWAEAMVE